MAIKKKFFCKKYYWQVDKIYDISQSKYKQLEKIRHITNDNVEATENENATQDDKFQTWEPKSKRMLQLFLTDGTQDVLAIEYKPIRFLKVRKNTLKPPFKNDLIILKYPSLFLLPILRIMYYLDTKSWLRDQLLAEKELYC